MRSDQSWLRTRRDAYNDRVTAVAAPRTTVTFRGRIRFSNDYVTPMAEALNRSRDPFGGRA
jgi:hypothetical protein